MMARQMTEIQKAWLAGFIDGEGCIGVYKQRSENRVHPLAYGVRICAVNTNSEVIEYIKTLVGCGCAFMYKKPPKNPKWRPVHRWQSQGETARDVIRQILPYLKVKRAIAELVLTMPICSKAGRSESDVSEQTRIFDEAKKMNRRGVHAAGN